MDRERSHFAAFDVANLRLVCGQNDCRWETDILLFSGGMIIKTAALIWCCGLAFLEKLMPWKCRQQRNFTKGQMSTGESSRQNIWHLIKTVETRMKKGFPFRVQQGMLYFNVRWFEENIKGGGLEERELPTLLLFIFGLWQLNCCWNDVPLLLFTNHHLSNRDDVAIFKRLAFLMICGRW